MIPHAPVPDPEHHHRNIQGGAARAAVFGISDGLVSNVSLVLGVAGAGPAQGVVRLAGLVGLLGGAFSMAAGEYVSMRAQQELLERELELERREIQHRPENERRELTAIYRARGIDAQTAETMASEVMRDPRIALETHAREELGIDPSALGSPVAASLSSFAAFAVGALVPLLPWFFAGGGLATVLSVLLAGVAALGVGAGIGYLSGRAPAFPALRQLAISGAAAGVSYALGTVVGGISAV